MLRPEYYLEIPCLIWEALALARLKWRGGGREAVVSEACEWHRRSQAAPGQHQNLADRQERMQRNTARGDNL